MAEIVSVSNGVMNPLLGKLTTLIGNECTKLKGVRKQATFLKDELSAMNAALEKLELMDELEPDRKNWRDHVREMAYDMEDCIDDFTRNLGVTDDKEGFIKKTTRRLKTLRARHRIAGQIEELKALAVETNKRRKRYNIDGSNSSSSFVAVDPRMSAIYKEAAGLVGIDGPREELTSWLIDTEQNLKVVSIVGFGGLGKTTLAKQLYDKIGDQFDCKVFIPVSQRPNVPGLLNNMQSKLGMMSSQDQDVHDIIVRLREHLKHKRYFIVVDDLWDQSAWENISCAFPDSGNGSRIIVTTRVEDVACFACNNRQQFVYRMKRLSNQDSERLFFSRIYGSHQCQFEEVTAEILRRCGGLPLAIITIASLLASHPETLQKDWESIRNYLDAKLATSRALEGMKSILNLSYIHLPLCLRACFLYLGMYPEDHEIKRDDLVRQWIAEGFVSGLPGLDLEDVAKSYFNELINRSMIQPERVEYGEVLSCRVHDMMLDVILSKCSEHNFVSVAYNSEDMARLHGCQHKVRRLLISTVGERTDVAMPGTIGASMSQVRSFALLVWRKCSPPLLLFKHLRVLVCDTSHSVDLRAISHLFQLRYLKVTGGTNMTIYLPAKIQGLVHLETLEVVRANTTLPSDMDHLPCLSNLIVPIFTRLPKGISKMKSLRVLHGFEIGNRWPEDIVALGELTNLRDLKLTFCEGVEATQVDAFVSLWKRLGKLRNLKYLSATGYDLNSDDRLGSLSEPPLYIEVLKLPHVLFSRVPSWIGDLRCLRNLVLYVKETSTDDFHVLGALPSLVDLRFYVMPSPLPNLGAVFGEGSFPVLEHLNLGADYGDFTAYIGFEAGSAPKLRRLTLHVYQEVWGGAAPFGMEHLLGLQEIDVKMYRNRKKSSVDVQVDVHRAESAFRNATQVHPSPPSFTITGPYYRPIKQST